MNSQSQGDVKVPSENGKEENFILHFPKDTPPPPPPTHGAHDSRNPSLRAHGIRKSFLVYNIWLLTLAHIAHTVAPDDTTYKDI